MHELTLIDPVDPDDPDDPNDCGWAPATPWPQGSPQSQGECAAGRVSGRALALLAVALVATASIGAALLAGTPTVDPNADPVEQPTLSGPSTETVPFRSGYGLEAPIGRVPANYGLEGPPPHRRVPANYGLEGPPPRAPWPYGLEGPLTVAE